jgi:hypothetical protein
LAAAANQAADLVVEGDGEVARCSELRTGTPAPMKAI